MDWEVIRFSFLNWDSIQQVYPLLLKGWWMTIKLCVAVVPLGFALGACIATMYSFKIRPMNWAIIGFVDFFSYFLISKFFCLLLIYKFFDLFLRILNSNSSKNNFY